jgi:hypothetical protein
MAARAVAYVRETHSPERVCAAFEQLVSGRAVGPRVAMRRNA